MPEDRSNDRPLIGELGKWDGISIYDSSIDDHILDMYRYAVPPPVPNYLVRIPELPRIEPNYNPAIREMFQRMQEESIHEINRSLWDQAQLNTTPSWTITTTDSTSDTNNFTVINSDTTLTDNARVRLDRARMLLEEVQLEKDLRKYLDNPPAEMILPQTNMFRRKVIKI